MCHGRGMGMNSLKHFSVKRAFTFWLNICNVLLDFIPDILRSEIKEDRVSTVSLLLSTLRTKVRRTLETVLSHVFYFPHCWKQFCSDFSHNVQFLGLLAVCCCSVCGWSHVLEVGSLDLKDWSLRIEVCSPFPMPPFKEVIAIACAWMLISAHLQSVLSNRFSSFCGLGLHQCQAWMSKELENFLCFQWQ